MADSGVIPGPMPSQKPQKVTSSNVCRPGPKFVRIKIDEDGQLSRVKFRPSREPKGIKMRDQTSSLVTASLMNVRLMDYNAF